MARQLEDYQVQDKAFIAFIKLGVARSLREQTFFVKQIEKLSPLSAVQDAVTSESFFRKHNNLHN